ncbi:MAG: hypothetical protein RLZZ230_593 [Candidatus Parcubacteria bacterium]
MNKVNKINALLTAVQPNIKLFAALHIAGNETKSNLVFISEDTVNKIKIYQPIQIDKTISGPSTELIQKFVLSVLKSFGKFSLNKFTIVVNRTSNGAYRIQIAQVPSK